MGQYHHSLLGVMDCRYRGFGKEGYQLGSWILYHGFIILSGSQVLLTSLMNGCPDTLWATANCRAKRGEGALPWTFSWVELQKG